MADEKRDSGRRSPAAEIAARARDELSDITGLGAEGVTSLEQAEDGTWIVTVELLELSRVPETDDVLGSYEVEVDGDGQLLAYRRLRRYARSQSDQAQPARGR